MKLSVIIPCHNEEKNIFLFYDEFKNAFKYYKDSFELIFVDDGSKDDTLSEIKKLIDKKNDNIKGISFSRNFGKEAAMYAGLVEAQGEYISIIDADLQQKPSVLLNMLKILEKDKNLDCVCAYQEKRKEGKIVSFFKKIFYRAINKTSEIEFHSGASDFRVFKREVAESIIKLGEHHRFLKGIFSFVGYKTEFIPYEVDKRLNGETNWSFKQLVRYAFDGVIAFSDILLKVPLYIGEIILLVSIIYLVVALILKVSISIALIIFMILICTSIILINIGLTNLYISRIYDEVKSRPNYIVRSIIVKEGNNKIENSKGKNLKWNF